MGSKNTDPKLENLTEFAPSDIDKGFPAFIRVNPIIKWSYNQVWDFLIRNNFPYCCLYK